MNTSIPSPLWKPREALLSLSSCYLILEDNLPSPIILRYWWKSITEDVKDVIYLPRYLFMLVVSEAFYLYSHQLWLTLNKCLYPQTFNMRIFWPNSDHAVIACCVPSPLLSLIILLSGCVPQCYWVSSRNRGSLLPQRQTNKSANAQNVWSNATSGGLLPWPRGNRNENVIRLPLKSCSVSSVSKT